MKVLNLYAGIGGNAKLWPADLDVTAVEWDREIAEVYSVNCPNHRVIVGDAHAFLIDHLDEYDLIWSSPPCQTHSRFTLSGRNRTRRYPDMRLYEEIIALKRWHEGIWLVENVKPWYGPMVVDCVTAIGRHYFWSNRSLMGITPVEQPSGFMNRQNQQGKADLLEWLGLECEPNIYYNGNHDPTQVLRNCVHPQLGLDIFEKLNCKETRQ